MKNNFKLRYSPEFYKDLSSIINYIRYNLENDIAAENLLDRIENSILERLKNPLNYEQYKTKGNNIYYRIYIKNYTIFYTISNTTMTIRRIIYSYRNLKELLS